MLALVSKSKYKPNTKVPWLVSDCDHEDHDVENTLTFKYVAYKAIAEYYLY